MLNIGRISGIIGLILYALDLIYATRLRLLEWLFGGLNRVYIAHHIVGGFALILLAIHPLFLSLQYVTTSLRKAGFLLIPHDLSPVTALLDVGHPSHLDVLQQWAIFAGILAFWGMVVLLVLTFFYKPPYPIWLFTHKFLGLAFFISGLHVLFVNSDTTTNAPLKYYLLFITTLGVVAFVYRTMLPGVFIRRYAYQVVEVTMQSRGSVKFSLLPLGQRVSYKPGQFVFMKFLNAQAVGINKEWHPFSISSAPSNGPLEIIAKALGDYTNNLARLQPGTIAKIEGAYGSFTFYEYSNPNQIWIAGGIGITPFLSMIKSLPPTGYNVDLYYSVSSEADVIEWQNIVQSVMIHPQQLRVLPFDSSKWQMHLDIKFILNYSGTVVGKEIFICGPTGMMKSLKKQLIEAGAEKRAIHSEEFAMVD